MSRAVSDYILNNLLDLSLEEKERLYFLNGIIPIKTDEAIQWEARAGEAEAKGNASEAESARERESKVLSEITGLYDEQKQIILDAQNRYIKRTATEQAVLDDARTLLGLAGTAGYEEQEKKSTLLKSYLTKSAQILARAGGAENLTEKDKQALEAVKAQTVNYSYNGYRSYLLNCVQLQLRALRENGHSDAALIELINTQAAAAYPPTPEELTQAEPEPNENAEEPQELDILKTSRADNFYSLNSTPINFLFNPERQERVLNQVAERENGQLFFADIDIFTGKKSKKEVYNQISVWYDDAAFAYTRNDRPVVLNDYDASVLDAIVTLIENDTKAFTLQMLYATMTQEEIHNIKMNPIISKRLKTALNRLEGTKVKYNIDGEQSAYSDSNGNTAKQIYEKESVLSLGEKGFIINGQLVDAYYLKEAPPLYVYSKNKGQILTTPRAALALDYGERNTAEVIALKRYLRTEIARISSPGQSNRITYDKIYTRISYVKNKELDKKQKQSIRQSAIRILGRFVQADIIKSFKEVKQGKAYHHIEITLPKKNTTGKALPGSASR